MITKIFGVKVVYTVTLLPCLLGCAQSGGRTSFRRWVWFTESYMLVVISFYMLFYLFILFLI